MTIQIEEIVNTQNLTVGDMKAMLMGLTTEELRAQCSHITSNHDLLEILRGEFDPNPLHLNVYDKLPSGLVVSRKLLQDGIKILSTVGIIVPGDYNFSTGENRETMTYLAGQLMAGTGNNAMHALKEGEIIIAQAGFVLKMRVEKGNVLYHCAYERQKSA